MELSSRTLKAMTDSTEKHNHVFIRSLFGLNTGLLPSTEFSCEGAFVRKSLEYRIRECIAVLPSGRILDVDEDGSLEIGALESGTYYLTVRFTDRKEEFECNCVPMTRPVYAFFLSTLKEFETNDSFPLMRLSVADGTVSLDADYMIPCLTLGSEKKYFRLVERISPVLEKIRNHPNLANGMAKASLQYLCGKIMEASPVAHTTDFHGLCLELVRTVDQYVFESASGERETIPEMNVFDVEIWFRWMEGYLAKAVDVLDGVVLEDNSIDYEALRKDLHDSLYESLRAEMMQSVQEMTDRMKDDLLASLSESLKNFVDGDVRPALHDTLGTELSEELSQKLYPSLYDSLYAALFVPKEEVEEIFTPLI